MIIATALGKLFEGLKVDVVNEGVSVSEKTVNYHYGDQEELLLWVKERGNLNKYPLIWYVLAPYTEHEGWYETDATLAVMQLTKADPLNTWRQANSYLGIINPVSNAVRNLLKNKFINIVSRDLATRFTYIDEPNFGVSQGKGLQDTTHSKSVSQDIVDARIIKFKLRIKAECLI